MMQPIPLAQPQGPQPPQNAQTMPGQTFGQPTGGVPGYAQPGQPKPKKPIWKQWWFWVIIVVVVVLDIATVSYTHLDVYKRQPFSVIGTG